MGGNDIKNALWLITTAVIMFAFPCLVVTLVNGNSGMVVCFILFFALNPFYAICSGIYAGKNVKKFWSLTIITALFFLIGAWLFFDMGEKSFIVYALIYLLIGIATMLISAFIKRKVK